MNDYIPGHIPAVITLSVIVGILLIGFIFLMVYLKIIKPNRNKNINNMAMATPEPTITTEIKEDIISGNITTPAPTPINNVEQPTTNPEVKEDKPTPIDTNLESNEHIQEEAIEKTVDKVSVAEVNDLMSDDEAETKTSSSERTTDRAKKVMINIDTISQYFKNGESVTLQEIKNRIPNFDKKATYYKVCARGILDKKLIVDADSFSIEAKKMILLTGGKVIVSVEKDK